MSRGNSTSFWRPVAVWVTVTVAATASAASAPGAWHTVMTSPGPEAVIDLLVAACTTALVLALTWLWVITTATVGGLLTGRPATGGGATRRLVLVACGAAVLAGTSVPALAAGGDGTELLVGLALPERAVAPPRTPQPPEAPPAPPAPATAGTYVVRTGDSLWSIARDHPQSTTPVDERWRAIWQANRDVVGGDPDLILPGQALRLPTFPTTQDPHSDGDRS